MDYSRWATRQMRDCSLKFSRDDSFWSIYNGLASIFESYGESYELILNSEKLTEALPRVEAPEEVEVVPSRGVRKKVG